MLSPAQSDPPVHVLVPVEERRESSRFAKEPGSEFAVIWLSHDNEQLVEVHDESLGGICLVMTDVAQLPIGTEMLLVYHGDLLRGRVRHVGTAAAHGRCLVGFHCERWLER